MASHSRISKIALSIAAAFSTGLTILPPASYAQSTVASAPDSVQSARTAPLSDAQLEQLVAPIALYPDALLSQILMASTYPLEVVEAARWRKAHPDLQGDALEDALNGQDWDPSVKSLVAFPSVLEMMNDRISWTSNLGDTFLAQQDSLMDSVQRLRSRAQAAGNLKSSSEQTVTVVPEGGSTVIRIEPAQPEVVYVPTYNPLVVYGPWPYPAYEPFYWYPPGYAVAAGVAISFGIGLFVGHALWGGYDWHRHSVRVVNVVNYNGFNHTHYRSVSWSHDPYHRRGVGYGDRAVGARMYHGDPGRHFAARENFRPRADAYRADLNRGGGWHGQGGRPGEGSGGGPRFGGDRGAGPSSHGAAGPDRTGGPDRSAGTPGRGLGPDRSSAGPSGGRASPDRGSQSERAAASQRGSGSGGMSGFGRAATRSPGTDGPAASSRGVGGGGWNGNGSVARTGGRSDGGGTPRMGGGSAGERGGFGGGRSGGERGGFGGGGSGGERGSFGGGGGHGGFGGGSGGHGGGGHGGGGHGRG
ncbi:hypothetical protein GCM10023144_01010 [Pigmentiphaga soli]|uniref:DUF3300 domain-containing protein n=1 Tax=Pigmentiphaga soli TaxID=1007095 RepID=A0ABP8GC86_9BURK